MSARSVAAYYAGVERPIAWCDEARSASRSAGCTETGARWSKKDGKRLCKSCRTALRQSMKAAPKVIDLMVELKKSLATPPRAPAREPEAGNS